MAVPLKGTTKGYLGLTGPEEEMPLGQRPQRLLLPPAAFLGNRGHRIKQTAEVIGFLQVTLKQEDMDKMKMCAKLWAVTKPC